MPDGNSTTFTKASAASIAVPPQKHFDNQSNGGLKTATDGLSNGTQAAQTGQEDEDDDRSYYRNELRIPYADGYHKDCVGMGHSNGSVSTARQGQDDKSLSLVHSAVKD